MTLQEAKEKFAMGMGYTVHPSFFNSAWMALVITYSRYDKNAEIMEYERLSVQLMNDFNNPETAL